MRKRFLDLNLRPQTLEIIAQANAILADYPDQRVSLRQLYYQFVGRDLLTPAHGWKPDKKTGSYNNVPNYKRLGGIISDARLAGLVDWDVITDRHSEFVHRSEWDSLSDLLESAFRSYRLPRWDGQERYVELWIEKAALIDAVEPVAEEFHVSVLPNHGYGSQTNLHVAASRLAAACNDNGKTATVVYVGDFDPSGEDMVRDLRARFAVFGCAVEVQKLALTMEQIRRHRLPPNPAKVTDPRARAYIRRWGNQSWEVDALPPDLLPRLLRAEFRKLVDLKKMQAIKAREDEHKKKLRTLLDRFVE